MIVVVIAVAVASIDGTSTGTTTVADACGGTVCSIFAHQTGC
jgi:hypothetical protein